MDGITKLAAALVAAQKDLTNPKFDKQNPHYHSKYASLAGIIDTVRPALLKHGLAVVQPIETGTTSGTIQVHTILIHTSGESIKSTQSAATPGDPQKLGSLVTYLRRYGLSALLMLAGDDDDDANVAAAPTPKTQQSLERHVEASAALSGVERAIATAAAPRASKAPARAAAAKGIRVDATVSKIEERTSAAGKEYAWIHTEDAGRLTSFDNIDGMSVGARYTFLLRNDRDGNPTIVDDFSACVSDEEIPF
jgi:hypothetical protein